MPLPVVFGQLPLGDNAATLLDDQFNALSGFVVIPCQAIGQNSIQLTPFADAPVMTAYTDLSPVFTWMAAETNTGDVALNVMMPAGGATGLGAYPAYKNNGADLVRAGDMIEGCVYQAVWLTHLNGGSGGFVTNAGPQRMPPPDKIPGDFEMPNFVLYSGPGQFTYRPHRHLVSAIIEGMGGGGAGGATIAGSPDAFGGGGGGSGGYFRIVVTRHEIGESQIATIGTGGIPSATSQGSGTMGTSTSFGQFATGNGGNAGQGADAGAGGGLAGDATLGTGMTGIAMTGTAGFPGLARINPPALLPGVTFGGAGGAVFGGGGAGLGTTPGTTKVGMDGTWGAGGAGGVVDNVPGSTTLGGRGGAGWILVTEYLDIRRDHDKDHDHDHDHHDRDHDHHHPDHRPHP